MLAGDHKVSSPVLDERKAVEDMLLTLDLELSSYRVGLSQVNETVFVYFFHHFSILQASVLLTLNIFYFNLKLNYLNHRFLPKVIYIFNNNKCFYLKTSLEFECGKRGGRLDFFCKRL